MLATSTRNTLLGNHVQHWSRHPVLGLAVIALSIASTPMMSTLHRDRAEQAITRLLPVHSMRLSQSEAKNESPEVKSAPAVSTRKEASDGHHRVLAEFVARRYRVSPDATLDLVAFAHEAARKFGLDPMLIIAMIAIESRFNPIAESGVGAKGLMQVIPRLHLEKLKDFGGEHAVFDPQTNILVGSRILKEYLTRTGNLGIALQMYAGALHDENDTYTVKVLNERQRLLQAANQSKRKAAPGEQR